MPDLLTVWDLAVLTIGGTLYALLSLSRRSSSTTSIAVRRLVHAARFARRSATPLSAFAPHAS